MLSTTVTVAVHEALLLLPSLAVTVTVLGPISAQVNALLDSVIVGGPQLSVAEFTTSELLMLALPLALRYTVTFLHVTVGAMLSTTVTVAVHEALLLLPSLAVTVTVLGPISAQVNALLDSVIVGGPQLSVAEFTTSELLMLALPLALRYTVTFL